VRDTNFHLYQNIAISHVGIRPDAKIHVSAVAGMHWMDRCGRFL